VESEHESSAKIHPISQEGIMQQLIRRCTVPRESLSLGNWLDYNRKMNGNADPMLVASVAVTQGIVTVSEGLPLTTSIYSSIISPSRISVLSAPFVPSTARHCSDICSFGLHHKPCVYFCINIPSYGSKRCCLHI